jgi:uncharacterized delta-60 repeat protein
MLIAAEVCTAQQINQLWAVRFDGPTSGYDRLTKMTSDYRGNVYVTGYSDGGLGIGLEMVTVKYDSNGIQQWVAVYTGQGTYHDYGSDLQVDSSGSVYLVGYSEDTTYQADMFVIKYDSAGIQQWITYYDGPVHGNDWAKSLRLDRQGDIIVTGSSESTNDHDIVTIKYNSAGQQLWVARFDGLLHYIDSPYDLELDNAGNVFVTGSTASSFENHDFITLKYSSNGIEQWAMIYDGPEHDDDAAWALVIDSQGSAVVTGNSASDWDQKDFCTIKYDTEGNLEWIARHAGIYGLGGFPWAMARDLSDNIIVTGNQVGEPSWLGGTDDDFLTIKYDSSGSLLWIAAYNGWGNGDDNAKDIATDQLGNVCVTGSSDAIYMGENIDFVTIKYSANGEVDWVTRYDGPAFGADYPASITTWGYRDVFVAGSSPGENTYLDYTLIRYQEPYIQGAENPTQVIPHSLCFHSPSPNPFNPSTTLSYELPTASEVKLTVCDTAGRLVATLVQGRQLAGGHSVTFDGSELPSGIYFARLEAGEFMQTQKLVLLK